MKTTKITSYSLLIALSISGALLVCFVAMRYSHDASTMIESGLGFLLLVTIAGLLWLYRNRLSQHTDSPNKNCLILFGVFLGMLWNIEISINNFIAPPLPGRDIIDNVYWAIIAASILIVSIINTYQKKLCPRH